MTSVLARVAPVALALALGLAACGGGDPLPAAGPEGRPAPGATPTPDRFGGVPVFPGSRPVALDLEGDVWNATYLTGAPLGEVAAFYDRALPDDGWSIEDREAGGGRVDYDARRGDEAARVRLRARQGGTEIRIAVDRD